jgi:hypothetical protein
MKSVNNGLRLLILLSLILGSLAAVPTLTVSAAMSDTIAADKGTSPEAYLNPDGTLNLDKNFSGSFDIEGWDVQLDPAHGPVFSPVSAQDNWSAVGSAGAFEQAVYSVIVNGSDVYVGGVFRDLDSIPEADHVARWDGTKWNALSSNGSGDGALVGNQVDTLAFSNGILYIGGTFFNVLNTSGANIANNLAQWDGNAWSAVGNLTLTGFNSVYEIAFYNDLIYIGGAFTDLNGIAEADYVASYNTMAATWSSLGDNGVGVGSIASYVSALAVDSSNGDLYVGGSFTNADGIAEADRIAKWNGSAWSALGTGIPNNVVYSILVNSSTEIYVGGSFTDVDSIAAADHVAKWNGSAWSALGSYSANGALNVSGISSPGVRSMLLNSGTLYVGGAFNMSDPSLAAGKYLAQYTIGTNEWGIVDDNGSGGSPLTLASTTGLYSIAFSAGELYLGGYQSGFDDNGAIQPNADYFSSVNTTTHAWSAYGIDNGVFQRNPVQAIAAIGTDVYVAGFFADANRDSRMDYLIRWDGSAWNPVGNLNQTNGSINNRVYALAVDGADLYVGGIFTSVENEGVPVTGTSRIAKWDTLTNTWSALGTGISNNEVNTLAVDASHNVYAGGNFTDVNSIPEADYIAKWNGSAWSALAGNGSGAGALNNTVRAIALNGATVYVGGNFTSVKDTSDTAIPNAAYLAQWNGSVWSAIPGTTSPFNNIVQALTYAGGNLYAGGNFSSANGVVGATVIAIWNSGTQIWSAMGNTPLNSYVASIAVDGANVYAGGIFTNAAGIATADYVAKWNGSSWSALGSNGAGNGSLNSTVYALAVIQNDLWVGGDFLNVNNNSTRLKAADKLAVFGLDLPPTVSSVTRASATPTGAASVDFAVTFSESVTGVDETDFSLTTSGVSSPAVSGISGSGSSYTVSVNTGSGNGTIRLDVLDDNSIIDTGTNSLSAGYTSGQVYDIEKTAPTVTSSVRVNPNPTALSSVDFTVTFSETVTGVNTADFSLTTTGVSSAAVSGLSGSGSVYTVSVSTGSGNGTLRLDVLDDNSIVDAANNSLGAAFTSGDVYTVTKIIPPPTTLVNSVLPTSRTIPVGTMATIFNTVINAGANMASGVTLSISPAPAGSFVYQQTSCATNAIIGGINPSIDINPGDVVCYVLSFTPSATFAATNVHIQAQAANAPSTNLLTGINTWLLRSTAVAGPDIIALTTTTDFHQVACSGANAFAVALSNVGAAATGDITAIASTGSATLPLVISIQETDPGTGAIIGDHILQSVGAGENRTVAVFVTFNGCVNFDPAANRIFIEFRDASNNVVGSTSTAVSTNR